MVARVINRYIPLKGKTIGDKETIYSIKCLIPNTIYVPSQYICIKVGPNSTDLNSSNDEVYL